MYNRFMQILVFPKAFYWGAATSAHQVEGNLHNNWTLWEKKNCDRLAGRAREIYKKDLNVGQELIKKYALDPKNYVSGVACDHYKRYQEDIKIMKDLNLNAYRFSIDWARVEPKEGKFSKKEIQHYLDVVTSLKDSGIEPFITIWHWPIPLWLNDYGGWKSKKVVGFFERLAQTLVEAMGCQIKYWITINEPMVFSSKSYLSGDWPPGERDVFSFFKVLDNLVKAHKKAYTVIKGICPEAMVGIAENNVFFEADKNLAINRLLKSVGEKFWNERFLERIEDFQDFIGLNYYFRREISLIPSKSERERERKGKRVSDMGWELYPEGIYHVLKGLQKFKKPIFITENGLADGKDQYREWFIAETLKWVHRAISDGVDIKGYLHWSLMDNFEWAYGFWPRFGLVEIDNENNLERKIRPSAYKYAEIAHSNALQL